MIKEDLMSTQAPKWVSLIVVIFLLTITQDYRTDLAKVKSLSFPPKGVTDRVSMAPDGTQGNGNSYYPSISADGCYVAFDSIATNLVSGDTNGSEDIFVEICQTGVTERASVASDGTQGNGDSGNTQISISADGRYVVFDSIATNLVNGDTNGSWDAFVHDRQTGVTERISVASDGTQGNGASYGGSITVDGRFVAFFSEASNLVSEDTNGKSDVFVHDRQTGVTERVSIATDSTQGDRDSEYPSISADGRVVAFDSGASNLVSGDNNLKMDVFVHDRQTGVTERLSVASDGTEGNGHSYTGEITADGHYVVFLSYASNLVSEDTNATRDIFVYDRQTDKTERVSVASDGTQGNDWSEHPSISADGRYVAFSSQASNLVTEDINGSSDVFAHDRQTGVTVRVSVASDGTQGNRYSEYSSISADGRNVAFNSLATNLVSGDTNECYDVFVHSYIFAIYLPAIKKSQ
jgi:Tol biopolymer transport system component